MFHAKCIIFSDATFLPILSIHMFLWVLQYLTCTFNSDFYIYCNEDKSRDVYMDGINSITPFAEYRHVVLIVRRMSSYQLE